MRDDGNASPGASLQEIAVSLKEISETLEKLFRLLERAVNEE